MAENLFTRLTPLTLNGSATVYTRADGQTADASQTLSGDTTDTVIRVKSYHGTARILGLTGTSLAVKVYGGMDNGSGTVSWVPVVSFGAGSSPTAADVAVVLADTATATKTLVSWDCTGFTHVKISRTAGSGTVAFCAVPLAGVTGMAGALAVLSAATINEDTAASDLEILMKGGSVRRDTPATSAGTTGDWATVNQDANGAAWVSLATLIAGENLTTNRMMVEHAYSYFAPVVADTLVKSGAGFLHEFDVTQNDAAPTAGTLAVLDATSAGTGTSIWSWTLTTAVFNPFCIVKDVAFNTGLFIDVTTTGDVNLAGSYR